MKNSFYIPLLSLFLALFISNIGGVDALCGEKARKSKDKDIADLENAIIIQGLEMESEQPFDENDSYDEGEIIYDNSFDDSLPVKTPDAKNALKKKGTKEKTTIDVPGISDLKAKDRRWHITRYKIKKNDNLWQIARKFGIDYRVIIKLNGIESPGSLHPGKSIKVPSRNGAIYTVRKGDTLFGLAKRFNMDKQKILSYNRIKADKIRVGSELFLPDVSQALMHTHVKKSESVNISANKSGLHISWPLHGRITSGFGTRNDPFTGVRKFHCGIDIGANIGTPVRAAAPGRVIFSGWKGGYGKVIIIRHKGGYITVYAHNNKNIVSENDWVPARKVIAYSGMSGAVTGAHLHFEVRKYINPLNPRRFLN